MMTDQNEPSMEDILASIRNILSDSDEAGGQPVSASMPAPEPTPAPVSAPIQASTPVPAPAMPAETPLEKEVLPVVDLTPDQIVTPDSTQTSSVSEEAPLIMPPTEQAAVDSLGNLARMFAKNAKSELGNSSVTLEDITRELLRPFLKEWLNENLPAVVERVVNKEIARVMDRLEIK